MFVLTHKKIVGISDSGLVDGKDFFAESCKMIIKKAQFSTNKSYDVKG